MRRAALLPAACVVAACVFTACGGAGAPEAPVVQTEPVVSGARGPVRTLGRPAGAVRTLGAAARGSLVVVAWTSGPRHQVEVAISRDGGRTFEAPLALEETPVPGAESGVALAVDVAAPRRGVARLWARQPAIEIRLGSTSSGVHAWRSWDARTFRSPVAVAGVAAGGWSAVDAVDARRVRLVPPVAAPGAAGRYLPSQVVRRPVDGAEFLAADVESTEMLFGVWRVPTDGGRLSVHRYVPDGPGHDHGGASGEFDIPFTLVRGVPAGTRAAGAASGAGAFVAWSDADARGPVVVGRQVVFDQWCVPGAVPPPGALPVASARPGQFDASTR